MISSPPGIKRGYGVVEAVKSAFWAILTYDQTKIVRAVRFHITNRHKEGTV